MIDFKGSQFEREIILWGMRWYVAYPISYGQLEEMMGERRVLGAHSTLNRWVIKYAPEVEKQFRRCQRPVGSTRIKLGGKRQCGLEKISLRAQTFAEALGTGAALADGFSCPVFSGDT
jgi:transposase-like protein